MSGKHEELSEQLAAWWQIQTNFKTKKDLAGFLNVHRDTVGDYFSGRRFPKPEIADRLYELTKITCLKPNASGDSPREKEGERNREKPVVISLQRTICPFCAHDIARFRSCGYCGQSFVWANVPISHGEPS